MGVLVAVNVIGLAVNLAGIVDPTFLTTLDARDLGFIVIKPSVLWFLAGILFQAIFCIPCIAVSVTNVVLFKPRKKFSAKAIEEGNNRARSKIPLVSPKKTTTTLQPPPLPLPSQSLASTSNTEK